jgi:Zn-dependent peptidase ImmA (M78 family)
MNKQTLRSLMPPDWNKRVFSALDFDLQCEAEGIRVFDCAMPLPGASVVYDDTPVIMLNCNLRGPGRLHVAWHEYGHQKLHAPGIQFFLNNHSRIETEANIVAACALIPCSLLSSMPLWEIARDYGYSPELMRFRLKVWRIWGF